MALQDGTAVLARHTEVTAAQNEGLADTKNLQEIFAKAQEGRRTDVCAVRDIITRVSDKWSLLTVLVLGGYGKMRFSQIRNHIPDVSQRMLTVTLRHLEQDGFVSREVFGEVPPRVEYELTPIGYRVMEQIGLFTRWVEAHSDEILSVRKKKR